jgi:response regulator RpfG family c-di-GMP phosphodiesterase
MSKEQARKALKNGGGSQWDPFLVDIFLAVLNSMDQEQQVTAS